MIKAYQDTTTTHAHTKKPENKNIPGIQSHDPYKNIINQATRIKI